MAVNKLLKDVYFNPDFFSRLSTQLKRIYPDLNREAFYQYTITNLDQLELKARITRTSQACRIHLPANYRKALKVLYRLSEGLGNNFSYMFMPEFVATYGLDEYDLSIKALRDFTEHSSSELAIRVFLDNDFERTMQVMYTWSSDDNHHVRRLASEGSRPRLPWATRVNRLMDNPSITYPILDQLKSDPEKYVQKSVANHLNDISKDHPDWLLDQIEQWDGSNKHTAWVIKHACRSLIKKGDMRALSLFGFTDNASLAPLQLNINNKTIHLGDKLGFSLSIQSESEKIQKLAIDYKIHFIKKSGQQQDKVFKLKELELKPGQKLDINKTHLFKEFTIRKHYPGQHAVEIIVNGQILARKDFILRCP